MTKFGIEATGMSDPNLSPAKFISQGVQDNSKAMRTQANTGLIAQAGQMGLDAYKGYQLADVEKNIEQEVIQEYMDRRDPSDLLLQTSALEKSGSLFQQFGATEEVSLVQQEYAKTLARYQKAKAQGVMSSEEFANRTLSVLRTAANKNPGLLPELQEQTKKVLELSGITKTVETDALIAKSNKDQADSYIKDLDTRLREQNEYYDATTPIHEKEAILQKAEGDAKAYTTFIRSKEYKEQFTSEQAISWVTSMGDATVRGGLSQFGKTVLDLGTTAEGTPANFSQIKAQVNFAALKEKDAFLQTIPVAIRNNPTVIQKIEAFNRGIDGTLLVLEGLGSGEDWKKAVTNHLQVSKTLQEQQVVDRVDVASTNLILETLKADPTFFAVDSKARTVLRDTLTDLLQGNLKSTSIDNAMPKDVNDISLSKYITSTAKVGRNSGNFSGLDTILDSYNSKTPLIKDNNQKQIFLFKNLEALSKTDLTGVNTGTVSKVKTMIGNYLHDPQYGVKSMLINVEKYGAILSVLDDGRVIFEGNNAQAFNERYGIKINTALAAYANAHNITVEKASKRFYSEYFSETVAKPDFTQVSPQETKGIIKR